jgi:pimeloyl-ACP methyl ester carboxylesterase
MRLMRLARLLLLVVSHVVIALAAAAVPHEGFYGGGYGVAPDFTFTQIQLKADANGAFTGALLQPYNRVGKFALVRIRIDGARMRFLSDIEGHTVGFDLTQTEIGYRGTASIDGRRQPASFVRRPAPAPPALLATYEGTYALGHGKLLTLSRNNASSGFWYVELPSGRTGYLFNLSEREFVAGPCFYCVEPVRLRIAFDEDGRLHVTDRFGANRIVPRANLIREEPVTFTSADGTQLAGTLYLPRSRGPHPAVVLLHGSNAQTRNGFYGMTRFMAEAYARRGIAALAFDKRGTGQSKGDWETADLDALADDGAAAVKLLRTRSDIDPQRIGLSGSSQAGWVVMLVTTRVPDLRLIQVQSGSPSIGVEEQERLRLVLQMRAEGYSQAEIDRALQIRGMMDAYAKTGQGYEELKAAYEPIEKTYWASEFIGGLPGPDAPDWPWLRTVFRYNLIPQLERYAGSMQFLFGQHDTPTPVAVAVPKLKTALEHGATRDWMIEIVPDATHNHYVGRNGGDREFPGLSRFVPGHFDRVVEWAAKRFGLAKRD